MPMFIKSYYLYFLGSGSLAAMAVFERGFKPNMEVGIMVSFATSRMSRCNNQTHSTCSILVNTQC